MLCSQIFAVAYLSTSPAGPAVDKVCYDCASLRRHFLPLPLSGLPPCEQTVCLSTTARCHPQLGPRTPTMYLVWLATPVNKTNAFMLMSITTSCVVQIVCMEGQAVMMWCSL